MLSYDDLLEDWIIYLKGKGLVKKQANPDGSLSYIRQPEASDLTSFLINSGFERGAIRTALQSAGVPDETDSQEALPAEEIPNQQEPEQSPVQEPAQEPEKGPEQAQPEKQIEVGKELEFPGVRDVKFQWNGRQWKLINLKSGKGTKIANREVSRVLSKMAKGIDPEMKELLDARKKLKLFASRQYTGNILSEDFKSAVYSEAQIKKIFQALTQNKPDEEDEISPEEDEDRKTMEINKIKKAIRDSFNDKQRKALWRILTNA